MKKEVRTIVYDEELEIEAYRLEGIVQPFPNHFHDFYVIGLMMGGARWLSCKNQEYVLKKGDMVIFNPRDNHHCAQSGTDPLNYGAINISKERMERLMEEVTGKKQLPCFFANVIQDKDAACYMKHLHDSIMENNKDLDQEENLILLLAHLIEKYAKSLENKNVDCKWEIEQACSFLEEHYAEHIELEQICQKAGLSKSTLLRAFTKLKGITPYRYLETIRIQEAKKLLEKGVTPVDAAFQTGFADQSHFTNYFTSFIGITPGGYRDIFRKGDKKEHED